MERRTDDRRQGGYSEEEHQRLVQEALQVQADQFAYNSLRREVAKLEKAVRDLTDFRDAFAAQVAALAETVHLHMELPMHEGTQELLDELGIKHLTVEQRALLPVVLRGAERIGERQRDRAAFLQTWQGRTSILLGTAGFVVVLMQDFGILPLLRRALHVP